MKYKDLKVGTNIGHGVKVVAVKDVEGLVSVEYNTGWIEARGRDDRVSAKQPKRRSK
jgi:hypothetical protein